MRVAAPRYTVDDLDQFPDDDQRYELLDGVLLVSPAPSQRHQAISGLLFGPLALPVRSAGVGRVTSPGRIQSGRGIRMEPDILMYPTPAAPTAEWTDVTTWWLAVEVLSPSTRVYDTEWKRQAYQALGVESVWLVDPVQETIAVWQGTSEAPVVAGTRLVWTCAAAPAITVDIDVANLFA